MSHNGNKIALSQRDKIVHSAKTIDKTAVNYIAGNNFKAAIYDCAGNLFLASIPQTVLGFGIVLPYFTVAYQGWVGGIVSVNDFHQSRFINFKRSAYYFIVLLLQFIPFSISIGAGIKCGIDSFKHNSKVSWKIWNYRIPLPSLKDLGYVYLLSIPLFLSLPALSFCLHGILGSIYIFFHILCNKL